MDIKLGSKWKFSADNNIIVEVFGVDEDYVAFKFLDISGSSTYEVEEFEDFFEPYVEFKWQKAECVELSDGDRIVYGTLFGDKQHELLYNYNRYRNQVDTTELNWERDNQKKWYNFYNHFEKRHSQNYSYNCSRENTCYFSSQQHAQTFLKLAQENDCL